MKQKPIFLRCYGNSPQFRVLDFLITFEDFDYSMKDIAKNSKIGYTTLKLIWNDLINRNVVVQTRFVGKAKMFKLNKDNLEIKAFIKLYWMVIDRETDLLLKSEKLMKIKN